MRRGVAKQDPQRFKMDEKLLLVDEYCSRFGHDCLRKNQKINLFMHGLLFAALKAKTAHKFVGRLLTTAQFKIMWKELSNHDEQLMKRKQ